MHTIRGIIADFKALYAKLNPVKWEVYRDSVTGQAWFNSYSPSGLISAAVAQYSYRVPMDEQLAFDGDFESAIRRGVARRRVATIGDIRSGLVSIEGSSPCQQSAKSSA